MTQAEAKQRIARLVVALDQLRPSQIGWIEAVVAQLQRATAFSRWEKSDLVTPCVLDDFGDALRIHHCFSAEPFSKDKFEYALERVMNLCGIAAQRVDSRTNPGHDITIAGQKFSLKTQADKGLKRDGLHISKFMELGKGDWGDQESDYVALRERFFDHMSRYDRILSLRRLAGTASSREWEYELVEIPKALLMKARNARLDVMKKSRQKGAIPAYYRVEEPPGKYQFKLYFDGGSERKLQIKDLDKSLCLVHATWRFAVEPKPTAKARGPQSARRVERVRGRRSRA